MRSPVTGLRARSIFHFSMLSVLASLAPFSAAGCAAPVGADTATEETASTASAATTTTTSLFTSTSLALRVSKTGTFTATTAGAHSFKTSGTGDVDLYVKVGAAASEASNDAKSEGPTSAEECKLTLKVGDKVSYSVYAYKASTAALTVTAPSATTPPPPSGGVYATTLSLPTLENADMFATFSAPGGTLSTSGRSLKILIDNRQPTKKTINFLNGNYKAGTTVPEYAKYHYAFAQRRYGINESTATFNDSTYFTQKKRFFAATLQTYSLGDGTSPTFAIQFYPDDVIAEETILEAVTAIRAAIAIPNAKLAFVATGPQQTFATIGDKASAMGVSLYTIDQVLGSVKYVGLNSGEAWGYLRIFPADVATLRATDIPVFSELPLDLSVVAGVITRAYQDINSHINLKSKERNTPNMVLRDASVDNVLLAPWADKPVHLTVTGEGFAIEASTDDVVKAKLKAKLDKPWVSLPIEDATALLSFDEMCPSISKGCLALSPKYGGKATGLAFLSNPSATGRASVPGTLSASFGYDLSPQGFGLPVKLYRDFVNAPENADLKGKIDALVAAEKGGDLSPADRIALATEVQLMFYKAKLTPKTLDEITQRVKTLMPGVEKLKFRSSATSEDVENFNGAGLYDSFSAEPAKVDNAEQSCKLDPEIENGVVTKLRMKPKTLNCAIKGVFASLWNPRALEERTFARLDHATAGMGIAVNPSYDIEDEVAANAVLVTRVIGSEVYGYTLSIQRDNNLVTNPEPGTISELDIAAFSDGNRPTRFTTARYAQPKASEAVLTTTVLTPAQMADLVNIAKTTEIAYCKAKRGYFTGDCNQVWLDIKKPRSLDMEFKILANGHYVLKQTREFHGK